MSTQIATKAEIITKYGRKPNDTGSPETQIALLTQRIEYLTGHMKSFPHDNGSRHGLIGMVSKRRKLMKYLRRVDIKGYRELISRLDLRDSFQ